MLSTDTVSLNPNPLVQALGKPAKEFTKADIIGYIEDNRISMVNLRYIGGDGASKPSILRFSPKRTSIGSSRSANASTDPPCSASSRRPPRTSTSSLACRQPS